MPRVILVEARPCDQGCAHREAKARVILALRLAGPATLTLELDADGDGVVSPGEEVLVERVGRAFQRGGAADPRAAAA